MAGDGGDVELGPCLEEDVGFRHVAALYGGYDDFLTGKICSVGFGASLEEKLEDVRGFLFRRRRSTEKPYLLRPFTSAPLDMRKSAMSTLPARRACHNVGETILRPWR